MDSRATVPRAGCFFLEEQLTRIGVLWPSGLYDNCPTLVFPSVSDFLLVFVFIHTGGSPWALPHVLPLHLPSL